ncbi:MAG: hypothetical protein KIG95_14225 [Comamonas sp.]|nr:hypothetical protein [Comamonas sp.]
MTYRVVLVKILPAAFVEDFLNGELYLNTCAYFSQLDQTDFVRADPHDGVLETIQVAEVAIQDDKGNWIPIEGVINPVVSRSDELLNFNIFCLYTITDQPADQFDDRVCEFGDVAIFISDLLEFVRRVREAAVASGWEISHGPVQYVDPVVHDGFMGPFRKFHTYSYQNEFRFLFRTKKRGPCRLSVGNLRDIIYVTASSKVAEIRQIMRGSDP